MLSQISESCREKGQRQTTPLLPSSCFESFTACKQRRAVKQRNKTTSLLPGLRATSNLSFHPHVLLHPPAKLELMAQGGKKAVCLNPRVQIQGRPCCTGPQQRLFLLTTRSQRGEVCSHGCQGNAPPAAAQQAARASPELEGKGHMLSRPHSPRKLTAVWVTAGAGPGHSIHTRILYFQQLFCCKPLFLAREIRWESAPGTTELKTDGREGWDSSCPTRTNL